MGKASPKSSIFLQIFSDFCKSLLTINEEVTKEGDDEVFFCTN